MLKWRKEFRCLFFICILFIQDSPVMKFKVSISLCFIIDKGDAFDVQKVYFLSKSEISWMLQAAIRSSLTFPYSEFPFGASFSLVLTQLILQLSGRPDGETDLPEK